MLSGGHKSPVTEFALANSLCVSAGREGSMAIWDINREKCITKFQHHQGQVANVRLHTDGLNTNLIISSGINDGIVNVYDMKSNKKVMGNVLHGGAINFLKSNQSNIIVTGSADKTIKTLDIMKNLSVIQMMKTSDSVFCGDLINNFCAVGCADGNLLAYNLDTGKCLYGYGVDNKGSSKCVKILEDKKRIISAGDCAKGIQLLYN